MTACVDGLKINCSKALLKIMLFKHWKDCIQSWWT